MGHFLMRSSGGLKAEWETGPTIHQVQSPKELMASACTFAADEYIIDKRTDEVKDSRRKRILKRFVAVTLAINA